MPSYSLQPYPLRSAPSISAEQAWAICSPRAHAEAQRAQYAAQQNNSMQRNQVTGYNCQTTRDPYAYNDTYTSNCTAQTRGYGSGYGGMAAAFTAGAMEANAYNDTSKYIMSRCMAESGWGLRSVCVKNCGDDRDKLHRTESAKEDANSSNVESNFDSLQYSKLPLLIYKEPSKDSEVLQYLWNKIKIKKISENGEFYKVESLTGEAGYASKDSFD